MFNIKGNKSTLIKRDWPLHIGTITIKILNLTDSRVLILQLGVLISLSPHFCSYTATSEIKEYTKIVYKATKKINVKVQHLQKFIVILTQGRNLWVWRGVHITIKPSSRPWSLGNVYQKTCFIGFLSTVDLLARKTYIKWIVYF